MVVMLKGQVFIHIGVPKTATSTWQENVFSKHKDINYLGIPFKDDGIAELMERIVNEDSLFYNESKSRDLFDKCIGNRIAGDKPTLLSFEVLTKVAQRPFNKGAADFGLVAQRIRQLFGDAKLILTIREQKSQLVSMYLQLCQRWYKRGDYIPFDSWIYSQLGHPDHMWIPSVLYSDIARYYEKLFGCGSLTVFLFEEFVNDESAYAGKISGYLGVDGDITLELLRQGRERGESIINPRISSRKFKYMQLRDTYVPQGFRRYIKPLAPLCMRKGMDEFFEKGAGAKVVINKNISRQLDDYYRENNRELRDKYKLDLDMYGYAT